MNRLFRSILTGSLFGAAAGTLLMIKRRKEAQRRRENRSGMKRIMSYLAGRMRGLYRLIPMGMLLRKN